MGYIAVDIKVLKTKDHFDRQGEGGGIADERPEGHGVDDGHRPGMLVAEDLVLAGQILPHLAGDQLEQEHRQGDDQGQDEPFGDIKAGPTDVGGQHQPQPKGGGDKANDQHEGDDSEGPKGTRNFRGNMLIANVVHAEPTGKGQWDQGQQPDIAGVLDVGFRAGGDLSDQRARGVLQGHGVAAEQTEGHHQWDDDLHGGDAKVAKSGVHPQGIALHPLGEEKADVGHRGGKVAAADA